MSSRRLRRFRGRHTEILSGDPSASSSSVSVSGTPSVSSHSFSASDFFPDARVHRPINAFVDETSGDLRRMHRSVVPIAPPSPVKRARQADTIVDAENVVPSWDPALPQPPNECYVMFGDDEFEDPPPLPPPRPPRTRAALFSDPTLYKWKSDSRDRYLREFLRHDGCGDASESVCPECEDGAHPPAYRVGSAGVGCYSVHECFVKRHVDNPLHVVEAWNGSCFERTSLQAMGPESAIRASSRRVLCCPRARSEGLRSAASQTAFMRVAVDFCGCEQPGAGGSSDTQLLRGGWYRRLKSGPKPA
ncbi:hypothetical protein B0H14DRAFT_3540248 [Mycena olivaceomarginata]|nr:hypothetical protein B0H14DRAFT_3540248 [Mycena olivaceomarginata]